jgi:UDP-glucose 4-epimerase
MVHELVDAGEETLALDNLSTGLRQLVPAAANLVVGDIGEAQLLRSLLTQNRTDTIIHFAGSVVVPASIGNPLSYYLNNTSNSRTLIQCAVEAGVKHHLFLDRCGVRHT